MATLSTHILDTTRGRPAEGVEVSLETQDGPSWRSIGGGTTNADGRIQAIVQEGEAFDPGVYRITFSTGAYFAARDTEAFYPSVSILFEVPESGRDEHFHVPLLLNPFGYSTYRGS